METSSPPVQSSRTATEELVFEGEGEARDVVIVSPIARRKRRQSPEEPIADRSIQSDTDASSSESLEGFPTQGLFEIITMENSYDLGIDAVSCPQPLCCSSPIRSFNSSESNLDHSKMSPDQSGFEGVGKGNEKSMIDHVALQVQLDELKFQNRKLLEEVTDLQRQIATADDAHTSLLCHNDELEKKIVQCRGHSEKLRFITKELEETKANLACHEDKHTVLKKRIDRLEKDNTILMEEIEDRRKENVGLLAELDRSRLQVKDYKEELNSVQMKFDEQINELTTAKSELEERLKLSATMIEELTVLNEQLLGEKQELESNLTLAHNDQLDSRLTGLEASVSADYYCGLNLEKVGDFTFEEEEDLISFRASSCTPIPNSIHSEIAASLRNRRFSSEFPQFRHDSLITYSTSGSSFLWDLESPDFSHRMRSILSEVLEDLRLIRKEFLRTSSDGEGKEGVYENSGPDATREKGLGAGLKCEAIEEAGEGVTVVNSSHEPEGTPKEVDVVRRIHEELAEFRVQLKKSQELFHAFNSTQAFEVTKSCPLLADDSDSATLAEEKVLKPQLSTVATQTDVPVVASSSSSPGLSAVEPRRSITLSGSPTIEDVENLSNYMNKLQLDDNDLDKLSLDDDSYRMTINLPTVLEESEQETETSPSTFPRRMSSERNKRNRLQRMSQFEEQNKSENESEREYYSPPSSLPSSKNTSTYNSLERPLQFSAVSPSCPAGDEYRDRESLISDSTYGSPLSSPSYYYTPSQGSSEETIANNDGDKTPVNEDFMDEFTNASDPGDSNRSSPKFLEKRKKPKKLCTPIDDRSHDFPQSGIDESTKEELTKYAYDTVQRSLCPEAAVLGREEWRTLKGDLRAKELQQYNKSFAQEEGTDNDGMDRGSVRVADITDPDDEAEKIIFESRFPDVVERLFESLDRLQLKAKDFKITTSEFEKINNRFLSLSTAFKTGHKSLPQREEQSTKEMETARSKINESVSQLKSFIEKMKEKEFEHSVDYLAVLHSMEQNSEELLTNSDTLTKKAKEVGSIDVEKRVYKLIEVMILYVHILRNYKDPLEEHKFSKKPSQHDDGNEDSPAKKFNGNIPSNNNNNHEKMRWAGGYLAEGQNMERWISKGYEFVRRELSWPWNWEQTWKGVKQCFSILLMLTGLLIIFKSVFPIVSADTRGCNNGHSAAFGSVLGKQASLVHEQTPTL